MKIFNLHTKNKKKIKGLKIVTYKEYDRKGKKCTNEYAEFIVIGNNSEWKDFMPLREFKRLNPDIKI